MAFLQIALGQPNAHRQDCIAVNPRHLDPIGGRILTLLMQHMLDLSRRSTAQSCNSNNGGNFECKHLENA